jgi:hypothetical protein
VSDSSTQKTQTELERLIAEQEKDMRFGHRVRSISIDVYTTDKRKQILDRVVEGNPGLGQLLRTPWREVVAFDPRHGRYSLYTNESCRCAKCKAASAAYWRGRRAQIRAELAAIRAAA